MKIKADFVTNSSSTCYIVEFARPFLRKEFEEYKTLRTGEYFRLFKNKSEVLRYTQQDEIDWVTEVTKVPTRFYGLSKFEFEKCIEIIEDGNYPVYVQLDRNDSDRREDIESIITNNGGLIRHVESD